MNDDTIVRPLLRARQTRLALRLLSAATFDADGQAHQHLSHQDVNDACAVVAALVLALEKATGEHVNA